MEDMACTETINDLCIRIKSDAGSVSSNRFHPQQRNELSGRLYGSQHSFPFPPQTSTSAEPDLSHTDNHTLTKKVILGSRFGFQGVLAFSSKNSLALFTSLLKSGRNGKGFTR
jgi:hypothetical protein